jgi:hypothetical protein
MNDFYEQKARKYKYKYLKLKQEIEGGGGMFGKSKARKEAQKKAREYDAEQAAAFDKKCRDIIAYENKNGRVFYNGAQGSYNKLAAERLKEYYDRDSSVRELYNIEAFKKDGCPTSEQEYNKIIQNNEAYDLRKAIEEENRPRLDAEAKAQDYAYNLRKAEEEAEAKAKMDAIKADPVQYEAYLRRNRRRDDE